MNFNPRHAVNAALITMTKEQFLKGVELSAEREDLERQKREIKSFKENRARWGDDKDKECNLRIMQSTDNYGDRYSSFILRKTICRAVLPLLWIYTKLALVKGWRK